MEKGTVIGVGVIICDRRVGFGVLESERDGQRDKDREGRTERQRQRDKDRETRTERQGQREKREREREERERETEERSGEEENDSSASNIISSHRLG